MKALTIETVNEEWEVDNVIDRNHLTEESLKTPNLHAKYLQMLMACKNKLIKLSNEYTTLKHDKFRYYRGEMGRDDLAARGWEQYQGNKPLKSDMEALLDVDPDLLVIKQRIQYCDNLVYQLESIMKAINARDWQIKNSIEHMKFIAGN